jgi:hypothetical protein
MKNDFVLRDAAARQDATCCGEKAVPQPIALVR